MKDLAYTVQTGKDFEEVSRLIGMLPDSGLGDLAAAVEDRLRGILDEIG